MFAEMSLGDLPEEIFSIQLYKSPKSFVSRRKESLGGGNGVASSEVQTKISMHNATKVENN